MQARNLLIRVFKFLGKAIVGLLLALLISVALLHVPFVQRWVSPLLADYLSQKINARVEIRQLRFSVRGNVAIHGLDVWSPDQKKVFAAQEIIVSSDIIDLLSGEINFKYVRIAGVDSHLIQDRDGLNIQFIIDAFSGKKEETSAEPTPVKIAFDRVSLENVLFQFRSSTSGTDVTVDLGSFNCEGADLLTTPLKIIAHKVNLSNTGVKILTTDQPAVMIDTIATPSGTLLSPDFGTGVAFEVGDLELKDNSFSFHRNEVKETTKFDPSHMVLDEIQIKLSDIIIHADTLVAALQHLSVKSSGFKVLDAGTVAHLNRSHFEFSELHLSTGSSELRAEITGPNSLTPGSTEDNMPAKVVAQGRIAPEDAAYFLNDSIMNLFYGWGITEFAADAGYTNRSGHVKTFDVKTRNSRLHSEGMINDCFDPAKLSWKDALVNVTIGSDFKNTLNSIFPGINLPPAATVRLESSGDLHSMFVDGTAGTSWGNAKLRGVVSRPLENMGIDLLLNGEKIDVGKWMDMAAIGPVDFTVNAKGNVSNTPEIEVNGVINSIELLQQPIHLIELEGSITKSAAAAKLVIKDPEYRSEINSEISMSGPLSITTYLQAEHFGLGKLLHIDSTLSISGDFKSGIEVSQFSVAGNVDGRRLLFQNDSIQYALDTLAIHTMISPSGSTFDYFTDDGKAKLVSNFDIREAGQMIKGWFAGNMNATNPEDQQAAGTRSLQFDVQLTSATPFQLLGIDVHDFSHVEVAGELDEQKKTAALRATSGNFKGFDISLDTLHTSIQSSRDSTSAGITAGNLFYKTTRLGNADAGAYTNGDTTVCNLQLTDSITLLAFQARILPTGGGVSIYPDKLQVFDYGYSMDRKNPVRLEKGNVVLDHFLVSSDKMLISLDGDLSKFDVNLKNVDLTHFNNLLSRDTITINGGSLNGEVSYAQDQELNFKANIDSLVLFNSSPLAIAATAVREQSQVPFEFHLTNASNKIDLGGKYLPDNNQVDASVQLDVSNLELFAFLLSGVFEKMHGGLKGEASILGPIQHPAIQGQLRLLDAGFTTANPALTFNIKDDLIVLDNSSLLLDKFTVYDEGNNSLTIDGKVTSPDYSSFNYDLKINTDRYALINRPDTVSTQLRGLLMIAADVRLTGNERDTKVDARITVRDTTNLTFVVASNDIEMLKSEGIIDFVAPAYLLDSATRDASSDFYDSLIASLPDFNLNSSVTIQDNAMIRILVDEQSGDYLQASGGANLELGYDRTGNVHLSGNYTIKKGVYRVSFYDLVKKNFTLVPGSSINFSGSPENGDLDIKAVYTVSSNSIGLIGHEIGENEKSIYKRSLEYQVGINIVGTVERPIVSFSLDLPQQEKVNFPVLANKLDRLRQPEFQSELNKQVFGLLVLGGFLPETSGSDFNSNLIATTALSNSVNSLLASQLNRFASQYIKGLNIDVGIQSYADYATGGGKTRTAMDFRVTKQVMNDRLSFEIGGDFDVNQDQSGTNTGDNFRGDMAIIYDLTGNGDKKIKVFNNETYDIIYQEIRNTGISLVFIREFDKSKKENSGDK